MNYLRKAIMAVGIVFTLSIVSTLTAYLFRLVIARNLTVEQFGLFSAALAFVITLHIFKDPGLKSALIKLIPEYIVRKDYLAINKIISQTLIVWAAASMLLATTTILLAPYVAEKYFGTGEAVKLLIILSIAFTFNIIDYLIAYVYQGLQKMTLFAGIDLTRMLIFLATAVIGFKFYPNNLFVPAYAYLISPILLTIVYLPILKIKVKELKIIPKLDVQLIKQMAQFGMPVTITSMAYTIFQQTSTLILTAYSTLTAVALLNVAIPTAAVLITLTSSIAYVIFPLSSELWARGHKKHLEEGTNLIYKYAIITMAPLSLMMAAYPELIITLLFGKDYAAASTALTVLAIATIFWVIASINFNILAGINKSKEPCKIMILITIAGIALNFVLIPKYGLTGAIITIAMAYFLTMVMSINAIKKEIQITIPKIFWIKAISAGTVFMLAIHLLKQKINLESQYFEAAIILAVAGAIYAIILLALKVTTIKEIRSYLDRFFA